MTKIALTKGKTKSADQVDETKYYGFVTSLSEKGFITREHYKNGKFKVLASELLTNGNNFSQFDDDSLKECVKKIIKSHKDTLFEFDTAQELFAWLAKEWVLGIAAKKF